ncbi:hypothetical protein LY625_12760 [Lysobacter sp. GX 14042]|uniref:hypothetical protein n=1 Tax=Lysobacter sp. GX 14042 TaxID=2907155 RepID=UPI001F23DFE5|nr:hypothetical protein [Lysobacter sp. GX 14042]MCE7033472.1 hypothetical protein [Lysobacter sp. GX 14042]
MSRNPRLEQRRLRVAQEAARMLAEGGLGDYTQAKLKAARRLGFRDEASLPHNTDVEQALLEYRRLFHPDAGEALRASRRAALAAMEFLVPFQPRLVGPVLEGTGDASTPVSLHLHSEDPDAVPRFLDQHGIPASPGERMVRLDGERRARVPAWHLEADGIGFELLVLPPAVLRQAPLSPVDDKPMQRASAGRLRELLGGDG